MILNIIILVLLLLTIMCYFYYNRTTITPLHVKSHDNIDQNNRLSIPFIHSI